MLTMLTMRYRVCGWGYASADTSPERTANRTNPGTSWMSRRSMSWARWGFHGLYGYAQPEGHRLGTQPLGDELEYFALARRYRVKRTRADAWHRINQRAQAGTYQVVIVHQQDACVTHDAADCALRTGVLQSALMCHAPSSVTAKMMNTSI